MKLDTLVTLLVVIAGDVALRADFVPLGIIAASLALVGVLIALQTAYLRGRISGYGEQQ